MASIEIENEGYTSSTTSTPSLYMGLMRAKNYIKNICNEAGEDIVNGEDGALVKTTISDLVALPFNNSEFNFGCPCLWSATQHYKHMLMLISNDRKFELINCEHKYEVFKITETPESKLPGTNLLHSATFYRRIDIMKKILDDCENFFYIDQKTGVNFQNGTALHLAAKTNFAEGIELLVKHGAKVDESDSFGFTPLHQAALCKSTDAARSLINCGASLKMIAANHHHTSALSMVLQKTPKAIDAVNRRLDESISFVNEQQNSNADSTERIILSFNLSDLQSCAGENPYSSLLNVFAKEHNLEHPLLRVMLRESWSRSKYIFYARAALCVLLLASITFFVWTNGNPSWQIYFLLILAAFDCVWEVVSFYSFAKRSSAYTFRNAVEHFLSSFDNYCDVTCYIGTLVFWLSGNSDLKNQLGPMIFLASWFKCVIMFSELPIFGLYADMYFHVLKSFTRLFLSFAVYLIGFMICFWMYLKNDKPFNNVDTAFTKVITMMVGELEYGGFLDLVTKHNEENSQTMPEWYRIFPNTCFTVFVVAVPILLMSLLLGIVVQDVNEIRKTARASRLARRAELAEYYLSTQALLADLVGEYFGHLLNKCFENPMQDEYKEEYILDDESLPRYMHIARYCGEQRQE